MGIVVPTSGMVIQTYSSEKEAEDTLFNDPLMQIGHPADNGPGPHPKIWFNKWFCGEAESMTVVAPACTWHRMGNKITKTYRDDYARPSGNPNPPPQIWILTDRFDSEGFQLGVWPD